MPEPIVEETVSQALSDPADSTPSQAPEATEEKLGEARAVAAEPEAPQEPDWKAEHQKLQEQHRALQSQKDREVAAARQEARQQADQMARQYITSVDDQRKQQYLEHLWNTDQVAYAEAVRRDQIEQREMRQRMEAAVNARNQTYQEYGVALLTELWNDPEYADLSQEEKTQAYNTAMAPALQQGRAATVTEINRELVKAVKAKTGAPSMQLQEQIKQMQAEIKAMRGENAGEAVRESSGPDKPATPAPAKGGFTPERIASMSDAEYDKHESDILKWMAGQ